MKREEITVCVVRVAGTNCDSETKRSFDELGVNTEIVHLSRIVKRRSLFDYDALVFPGGFSHGDYVRAGAIWAKELTAKLGHDITKFVEEERPILGICNGFQVLVESGLLPAFEGRSEFPEAALATNSPIGYYCSWVYIRNENSGKCIFTNKIQKGKVLRVPVAHAEGRFIFSKKKKIQSLEKLYNNDQLVFLYCDENGVRADGKYPENPNGSFHDIAGICDPTGTVFGLMPHPERGFYGWQMPDWTRRKRLCKFGDGRLIFESMICHLLKKS